MKRFLIILIICFQLIVVSFVYAEDILSVGIWQVVELDPKGDNPLDKEDSYYVFLPNKTLIEITVPKSDSFPIKTETSEFQYKDGTLTIKHNGVVNKHKVMQIGSRVKMLVLFGAIWLEKVPDKSLQRPAKAGL